MWSSVWFLSLTIMSSRFIHTVASVSAPLLFKAESYSTGWMEHVVCPFTCQWTSGFFPDERVIVSQQPFRYCESCCCEQVCTSVYVSLFSLTLG